MQTLNSSPTSTYFYFSPSRQDYGRTGKLFLHMFYWLLLLTRVSWHSLGTPTKSFVEVPCIVISGACSHETRQMGGAQHAFESC